jgi:hypothetical protein
MELSLVKSCRRSMPCQRVRDILYTPIRREKSMDYERYEEQCEKIRKENEVFLSIFESDLEKAGLSSKTIRNHLYNVDFYLNEYLLREEAIPMKEGCQAISDFLGYFFIRKCMWSTPSSVKSNATSLKKFYKCMLTHNHVENADVLYLMGTIKEEMATWVIDCEQYNDPDQPSPFFNFNDYF